MGNLKWMPTEYEKLPTKQRPSDTFVVCHTQSPVESTRALLVTTFNKQMSQQLIQNQKNLKGFLKWATKIYSYISEILQWRIGWYQKSKIHILATYQKSKCQ